MGEFHQRGTAKKVDYGLKMLLKQRPQFAVRDVSCRHDEQRAWLAREQMALSEVSVLGDKYPLASSATRATSASLVLLPAGSADTWMAS